MSGGDIARLKRRLWHAETGDDVRLIMRSLGLSRHEAGVVYEKIFWLGKQHGMRIAAASTPEPVTAAAPAKPLLLRMLGGNP